MEQAFVNELLLELLAAVGTIAIVMMVLFVVAEWRILTKAGEKGWKSLIPVYSVFVSHHVAGMSHIWFIIEVVLWIAELVFAFVRLPEPVVFWFGVAAGAFTIVSEVVHAIKMCNCFSKGTGFKIGMIFLPNIFTMIMAFDKSEYKKPQH